MGTTIAIDLAKNVFELAVADESGEVLERKRLSRAQFTRFFDNRHVDRVVMEACGTAHFWGRWFAGRGVAVSLLPAQYVRAYVRRNKTDRADAAALPEAAKAPDILPVQVKVRRAAGVAESAPRAPGLDIDARRSHQHSARPVSGVWHQCPVHDLSLATQPDDGRVARGTVALFANFDR